MIFDVDDISEIEEEYEIKLKKKGKEIERLKQELEDTKENLGEYLHEQEEENKRLKNIINELEKWLKEAQILYGINQQGFSWGVCEDALNKLQELKESDK